jgi:hypothetical protein
VRERERKRGSDVVATVVVAISAVIDAAITPMFDAADAFTESDRLMG